MANTVKGFTLLEVIVVLGIIAFVVCIGAMVASAPKDALDGVGSNISFGINGFTETRCINGYMFVVGGDGSTRQVLDEFGKGARCK